MCPSSLRHLSVCSAGALALLLAGVAGATGSGTCQTSEPAAGLTARWSSDPGCDSVQGQGTVCCSVSFTHSDSGSCSVTKSGKTLTVKAEFIRQGNTPGISFNVPLDEITGRLPEGALQVDQVITKGKKGGTNCLYSWSPDLPTGSGLGVKLGMVEKPTQVFFFSNGVADQPGKLSRFIPNCRDLETIGGPNGVTIDPKTFCPNSAHDAGHNELLVAIFEIRDEDGKRVPYFGQQIGEGKDADIDTTNFCKCNHRATQPDENNDDGIDQACDANTPPGEQNPRSGEYGCQVEEDDPSNPGLRVPGGITSINPVCSRWGTNRCY